MGFGPVLIIGAGVSGLSIARGLQKSNIAFHMFEADDEPIRHAVDETATIRRSLALLRDLVPNDATDRLETDVAVNAILDHGQRSNGGIRVLDGNSGQTIRDVEERNQSLTVSKPKLRTFLRQGLDIKSRHALQNIEYTDDGNVFAVFANGERYWGSLVVGADGPCSVVRQMLFGEARARPKPTEAVHVNVSLTYPPKVAQIICATKSTTSISVVQDCVASVSILDMSDLSEPATWRFQVFICWRKEKESKKERFTQSNQRIVKAKAELFSEPFRSAILCIPNELELQIENVTSWTPTPWHTRGGRITLAGIAAHSMSPNSGQGLENSIADAHSFVRNIKNIVVGDSIKAHAIPAYGHEIVARAIKQAQLNGDVLHTVLESAVYNKGIFSKQSLAISLQATDSAETLSESSTKASGSQRSSGTQSRASSKKSNALSRTRTWFRNQIENLDVGAEQGTAQTGWVQVGQRVRIAFN